MNPSRIAENIKAVGIKLDADDMKRLRELGSKNFRVLKVIDMKLVYTSQRPNSVSMRAWGLVRLQFESELACSYSFLNLTARSGVSFSVVRTSLYS